MGVTAEERQKIEQEVRDTIRAERLAYQAEWRRTHKAEISAYSRKYYAKKKERKINGERR